MNTTLIIDETEGNLADYAAGIAANLVITNLGVAYDDWYLPSKFELNLMWINLADSDGDGNNTGVDDINNLGRFVLDGNYWSSSQYNSTYAWRQYFDNGYQAQTYTKSSALRVRAVRAF
jgi:hypothetical protein